MGYFNDVCDPKKSELVWFEAFAKRFSAEEVHCTATPSGPICSSENGWGSTQYTHADIVMTNLMRQISSDGKSYTVEAAQVSNYNQITHTLEPIHHQFNLYDADGRLLTSLQREVCENWLLGNPLQLPAVKILAGALQTIIGSDLYVGVEVPTDNGWLPRTPVTPDPITLTPLLFGLAH